MKISRYIPLSILTFLGFLIYSNALYGPFIFDDDIFIVKNDYRLKNIFWVFKDFYGTRYIGSLSFALNYYFGGLNTFGYHLVNIVIHILNAILVYVLVSLTFTVLSLRGVLAPKQSQNEIASASPRNDITPNLIAFTVSLIFLVHPIQTQSVSYITQRFTSLATLFYLLALVLYIKARLKGREIKRIKGEKEFYIFISLPFYLLSLISAVLAMKTKEFSFTLPFIILLYEFTFFDSRLTTINSRLLYLVPYLLTLLIIPVEIFSNINPNINPNENWLKGQLQQEPYKLLKILPNTILTPFNAVFQATITNIMLLSFPVNQYFEYENLLNKSISPANAFLSFASVTSIICFAIFLYLRSRKKDNMYGLLISFGMFWFFITMSVNLIISVGVIFEHWLYLPSAGFIISITASLFYLFDYLQQKTARPLLKYLLTFIGVLTLAFSILTYKRNLLWADAVKMYLYEIDKSPNAPHLYAGLGDAYQDKGMLDEAIKEYMFAIKLDPNYASPFYQLGNIYAKHGRMDEAIEKYLTALRFKPEHGFAHYNLGNVYSSQGRLDEAIQEYLTALRLYPYYVDARINLGNTYLQQGRFYEAIDELLIALKTDSNSSKLHNNMGVAYFNLGLLNNALQEFETTLKLDPNDAKAIDNFNEVSRLKNKGVNKSLKHNYHPTQNMH